MNISGYFRHLIQTTTHKFWVAWYLFCYVLSGRHDAHWHLLRRALTHDLSKYRWSEARYFAEVTFALRRTLYGTDAYRRLLAQLKPATILHYQRNLHHPEHHPNGFHGMSRDDLIEMVADWCAAARRNGNVFKSIEFNQQRFGYNDHAKRRLIDIARIMHQETQ